MILTRHNLYDFLVARGLIDATAPLDGRLEIRDRSGRNRSFVAAHGEGDGCFVKQAGLGVSAGGRHSEREAACFQMAGDWPELRTILSELRLHDKAVRTLVMELIPGDNLLRSQAARREFDVEYAASLGGGIGRAGRVGRRAEGPIGGEHGLSVGHALDPARQLAGAAVEVWRPHRGTGIGGRHCS